MSLISINNLRKITMKKLRKITMKKLRKIASNMILDMGLSIMIWILLTHIVLDLGVVFNITFLEDFSYQQILGVIFITKVIVSFTSSRDIVWAIERKDQTTTERVVEIITIKIITTILILSSWLLGYLLNYFLC